MITLITFYCLSEKVQLQEEIIAHDGQDQGILIDLDLFSWCTVADYPVFLWLIGYAVWSWQCNFLRSNLYAQCGLELTMPNQELHARVPG